MSTDPLRFGDAYFDDAIARRYGRQHLRADRWLSHRRESRIVARLLGPAPADGIAWALDAPSGSGRFAATLHRLGFRVIALDRALPMCEQALGNGADQVARGSVSELPLVDDSLAAMLCARFLHHLPERDQRVACLREMRRVTRGPIVCSAWIETPFKRWRRHRRRRSSTRYLITRDELASCAAEAGLMVESSLTHVPLWSPIVYFRLVRVEVSQPQDALRAS